MRHWKYVKPNVHTYKEKLSAEAKERNITKVKLVNDIDPYKLGNIKWSEVKGLVFAPTPVSNSKT